MIAIELTRAQKIQICVGVLILAGAAYLIFKGRQPAPDMNVASWSERTVLPRNPALPVSASNPLDPTKAAISTIFACFDGRLEITEYPASSDLHAQFTFTPDYRRKTFTVFQDLLVTIEAMSDPYKRALSYSAYRVVEQLPPLGLLNAAAMTADQRKAEKEARETMINLVTLVNNGAETGIFEPDAYKRVMTALAAYKAAPGDPAKVPAKAELAHKVVALAVQYIGLMENQKGAAISKYVATVDTILTTDQRAKVEKVAEKVRIQNRAPRRKMPVMAGA